MSGPKFSVIIPLCRGMGCIGGAIDSGLRRTDRLFEVIVVDDAWPDRAADVVRGFRDPRLRLIEQGTNRGSDASRQTGLQASTGDVIAFLDQDDFIHPDK